MSSGDLSCVVLWAACRDEGNGALQQKKKETDSGYVLHSTETRTTHGKERKRADECNRRHPTEGRGKFFSIQNIPLIYFFFLGVAGYCWTRQPKKKKSRGGKNLYRIDAISFPSGLRLTRMRTVEANIQQYRYIYAESLRTGGCECASPSSFCAFFLRGISVDIFVSWR